MARISSENVLKLLSILITAISVASSILIYSHSSRLRESSQTTIMDQAKELASVYGEINESKQIIDKGKQTVDSLERMKTLLSAKTDSLTLAACKKDSLINALTKNLYEDRPILIDATDSEQLRIFLQWARLF